MRLAYLALIALGLLTSSSSAETPFHCPESGTVLQFTDGTILTFTTQDGLTCRARSNKGALVAQFLGVVPAEIELDKHEGERLFPWRVGNQVDFVSAPTPVNAAGDIAYMAKDAYFDNSFKVLREEKVTTAAGAFDTMVVEWHRQIRGRWLGVWVTTYWVAPELGFFVKLTRETRQGAPTPNVAYELASITRPGTSTAPVARAAAMPSPPAAAATTAPAAGAATATDTVKLEQANGQFVVPAEVNGKITLNFILDSGASDVAIPGDVVQTLKNSGTLSTADFIGKKTYVLADGSKLPSETFILHQIRVGSHVLANVTASVSPVQGKLLLGQSFLSRLSGWAIDNKRHALLIMGDAAEVSAQAAPLAPPAPAVPPTQVAAVPPKPVAAPSPTPSSPPPIAVSLPATSPAAAMPPTGVASAAGAAGTSAFRCPRPGTVIEYSNGTRLKFAGENGFRCGYTDQYLRDAEKFAAFADSPKFLEAGLQGLWPLVVGKEQTVAVTLSGAYTTHHFTVLRTETIATPAGRFEAFVVEQEETGTGVQWAKRLYWYVPETGLIVKSTFVLLRQARLTGAGMATSSLVPGDYLAVRIQDPGARPGP